MSGSIYTLSVNYRSGTYLSQFEALNPEYALRAWMASKDAINVAGSEYGARLSDWLTSLKWQFDNWPPEEIIVPISALKNCWAVHFLALDESVFIDMIKTDAQP